MPDLPGVYMRAPETWPFRTPTIPSKIVPSHKTYAPNNEGLVLVDPNDIATLLGFGFYLYGQSPDVNAMLAGLPGAGDSSMFLAMDGIGRTPGGGGGGASGLVLLPGSGPIPDPVSFFDFTVTDACLGLILRYFGLRQSGTSGFALAVSFDGGTTFLNDIVNFDSYNGGEIGVQVDRTVFGQYFSDSLCPLDGYPVTSGDWLAGQASISLGDSTSFFSLQNAVPFVNSTRTTPSFTSGSVNPGAVVVPTPGRVNFFRTLPYGNGDCDPPTGGETFTADFLGVWGVIAA